MKLFKNTNFKVGQPVVYRKPKSSTSPGQRAINVRPAPAGETYCYEVEKYWTVSAVINEDQIELQTRSGKQHIVSRDDSRLRHATIIERLFMSDRFPKPDSGAFESTAV